MIGWGLFPPPGDAQSGCLDEIREFRARVLYEAGRRPAFRDADGCYADRDPLDGAAHHVYARVAGVIVGSVRLLPVHALDLCLTEQLIGPVRFAQMLRTLNVNRVETIEGGRWVVDPAHRVGRLGVLLSRSRSCGRAGVGIPHARLSGWNAKETGSRAGTSRSRNCCRCPADYRAALGRRRARDARAAEPGWAPPSRADGQRRGGTQAPANSPHRRWPTGPNRLCFMRRRRHGCVLPLSRGECRVNVDPETRPDTLQRLALQLRRHMDTKGGS